MASTPFADLRRVRGLLGKSQSEMAALLGISTRAVQSYEQGWRPSPAYQFQAGDLCWLFPPSPCSELRGASWEDRIAVCEKCAVMRSWLEP